MSDEEGNENFPRGQGGTENKTEKTDEKAADPVHIPGVRQGNEMVKEEGKEAGRFSKGTTGADRPAGGSTSRDSTGISDEDPVDPDSVSTPSS